MIRRRNDLTLAQSFEGLRADYDAARSSRFRRRRTGVPAMGAGADYHYRSEAHYLKIMEYARDMDRNDLVLGQTVDRAVGNTIQGGFGLNATTGDDKLSAWLEGRWLEFSEDRDLCDVAGEHTFWDFENMALRGCLVDGDVQGLATDSKALEMIEGHRLRTPRNALKSAKYKLPNRQSAIVHGILIDDQRRPLEYWFTKNDIEPSAPLNNINEVRAIPARDQHGHRQVFHVMLQKRPSQTRGVSALAPMFDALGMFEDIQFATMVQRQMVACFAIFHERDLGFTLPGTEPAHGPQTEETAGGYTRTMEGLGPGMELFGLPGEKLSMSSANIPNPEFFPHMKMILQLIGVNLGMPLVMVLLDASETNFSGWRGAVDQAKMGFRSNQKRLAERLHVPVYEWQARGWLEADAGMRRLARRKGVLPLSHRWNFPTWPYIEPLKDASADLLRIRNALISRRRQCGERSMDWETLSTEIVEDNVMFISKAALAAAVLNEKFPGMGITWREVACLPTPDGVKISLAADAPGDAGSGTNQTETGNA